MSDKADSSTPDRIQAEKAEFPFGKNMKAALGHRDMAWLSRETGISTSTLSDYGQGKLPRADKALQIAHALDVTVESLMSSSDGSAGSARLSEERLSWHGPVPVAGDLVEVAEIDLRYGMGGTFLDDAVESEPRQFSRAWLRNFTDSPPAELFWAKGQGNSMTSTIDDGDIVLIDRRQDTLVMADLIWAFGFGQVGMIKRLRPMPDGSVKILSDNPAVPLESAVDGELHLVGRVVAVVKRV